MDNRNYHVIILLFSQHTDDTELRIIILLGKVGLLLLLLLIQWNTVLEKRITARLVNEFLALYVTRRYIALSPTSPSSISQWIPRLVCNPTEHCPFPYITQMTFDKEKQQCLSRRSVRWFGQAPVFHTFHTTDFLQNKPKLRFLKTRCFQ